MSKEPWEEYEDQYSKQLEKNPDHTRDSAHRATEDSLREESDFKEWLRDSSFWEPRL